MPRPMRFRRIDREPGTTYFKPAGIPRSSLGEVVISFEEYEAVRLKDLVGLEQSEAADKMSISQPTFHRLIRCARNKIADAIINGKAIKIEGGAYMVRSNTSHVKGYCICVSCGYKEKKERSVPCSGKRCPGCGAYMMRGD